MANRNVNIFRLGVSLRTAVNKQIALQTRSMRGAVIAFRELALVCLLFLPAVVGLQGVSGAFRNEFGVHPDEAAHYMTGLMVRDYVTTFPHGNPMSFAQDHYLHYPKSAFGHWPPLFYVVQTVWTLLFGVSHSSLLMLMALTTTLLSATVYWVVRAEFGIGAGIAIGLLLIALPLTQEGSGALMADMLLALVSFWAVLCFSRFLETERARDAIGFGILAALAIMTKGQAMALVLFPPAAVILSRRFHLLTRASFWYPAGVVLVACGPWLWLTRRMWSNGVPERPGLWFILVDMLTLSSSLTKIVGIGLTLMVAIGFFVRVIKPWSERKLKSLWGAAGAWFLSSWLFLSFAPGGSSEMRYLLSAVPALLMFLAAGIAWVAERVPGGRFSAQQKASAFAVVALLVFAVETFRIPRYINGGFAEVAKTILSKPEFQDSVLLIDSDARGEGAFIAEVARRERRPGHLVLRASKVLAESAWGGEHYRTLYQTTDEVRQFLSEVPVGLVVVDTLLDPDQLDHHHQLREVLKSDSSAWELLGTYAYQNTPISRPYLYRPKGEIRLYRQIGHENKPINKISIGMRWSLNEAIEK